MRGCTCSKLVCTLCFQQTMNLDAHGGALCVDEGNRGRGRSRRTWIDGISDWNNRSVIGCVQAGGRRSVDVEEESGVIKVPQRTTGYGNDLTWLDLLIFMLNLHRSSQNTPALTKGWEFLLTAGHTVMYLLMPWLWSLHELHLISSSA